MRSAPARTIVAVCLASICTGPLADARGEELDLAFAVTPSEAKGLARGDRFARVVSSSDPTEVVTIGGVTLRVGPEAFARCAMTPGCLRRRAESQAGRLGASPKPGDLHSLRLDERDLRELRQCSVGRCELRLPRDVIELVGREIDWSAPDAASRADGLFRAFLAGRATTYLEGGHEALPPYADRANGTDIAAGTALLLQRSLPPLDAAPDLVGYLHGFPESLATLTDQYIAWQRERIHRKSVVSLEHVVVARRDDVGAERVLVVSKKIYSSHYFESCLEAAEYVRRHGEPEGRLVIAARYRTDVRRSGFNWLEKVLLRRMVKGQIESELDELRARLGSAGGRTARAGTAAAAWEGGEASSPGKPLLDGDR